ncbi:MAG: alkaline phosphatase [Bacteroidales bacterium]|nr:alkaline phosphatase [Bacteroidales bacterium]
MNRKLIKPLFIAVILVMASFSPQADADARAPKGKVKNIILFIGDGMGTAHVYAGMSVSQEPLVLESFPYTGYSKTNSSNNYVTDSAAGGTALACGIKTKNGMIGVAPDSSAVQSIIELAKKNGLATGVLSTSSVTHATPASFVAHNAGRGNYEDIAKDFLSGSADVIIGGGEDHFRKRKDGADLTVKLKEMGYDVVFNLEDMKKSGSQKLVGLLAKEHMPRVSEGRQGMLAEMVKKAIEVLSQDKDGFFLMVEGSMIDWGGHAKDFDYVTQEMIDLDQAVGVAKKFAEADGKTLILVTADHETGGLTLTSGDIRNRKATGNFIQSGNHTGIMVPVFSLGPQAERFTGIHDNTYFFSQYLELLKLKKF